MFSIPTNQFNTNISGKKVLIFGAVHGNEPCGTAAINQIASDIKKNLLSLNAGSLTMVPQCNLDASKANVRFIDNDLNRIFEHHDDSSSYESSLANTLTKLVDECDVLLDIHSMRAATKAPFVFQDYNDETSQKWVQSLGIETVLTGWPEIYAGSGYMDTLTYAHQKGKSALCIECGQNEDPTAAQVAYDSIIQTLIFFGLVDSYYSKQATHKPTLVYEGKELVKVPLEGGKLTQEWAHMQNVKGGTVLATSHDGQKIVAPFNNTVIMLPKHHAKAGQEWFYMGTKCAPQ